MSEKDKKLRHSWRGKKHKRTQKRIVPKEAYPWSVTRLVEEKSKALGVEVNIIERANHSLETRSAVVDAENMMEVLSKIERYVENL